MKAYLSRRYRISASHRLDSPAFDAEKNRAVYGKCNHPYGHGHNYIVEVTMGGPVDETTGMVLNLADLDACVDREVVQRFDLMNLNLAAEFQERVPTTENLSRAIFDLLSAHFISPGGAHLERVRIEETASNSIEYAGKEEHEPSRNC